MSPVAIAGREIPFGLALFLAALLYFALAQLGLGFAHLQESASPVWPASGFAVALVALYGWRLAPAIFLGAFAVNLLLGNVATALPIATGNMLEALTGAWLLHRLARLDSDFFPFARAAGIVAAALIAALVSAAIGLATLTTAGMLNGAGPASIALTWWAGDAIGILLVTPVLLQLAAAFQNGASHDSRRSWPGLLFVAATPLATLPAFVAGPAFAAAIFLALPVLVLALRRAGPLAAGAAPWAGPSPPPPATAPSSPPMPMPAFSTCRSCWPPSPSAG